MKTKLLNVIIILFLIIASLALILNPQTNLVRPYLSLPETAGVVKPVLSPGRTILPASSLALPGPAAPPAPGDVAPFVKMLHIHGIPYDQARQFGPEAVPILLELLADPQNAPYATNIVVTLGFIGHPSAHQPLLDYLTQTEGEVSLDEFRGLTSVPYALGQLAHQGDSSSLAFLLQAADRSYWNSQTPPWTYNGQTHSLDLYHNSLLALGLSGLPQALARLEEIVGQGGLSAQENSDVLQQALVLNRRVQQEGMAPVVSPNPNLLPPADMLEAIGSLADDTNADSHLQTFTVARHITMGGIPTNAQVDAILNKASEIIQTADSPTDISCCVALQRSGSVGTFSVTDGIIGTNSELNTVFNVSSHQVKIVPILDYCGGPNPSTIGCAYVNSPINMILEHLDNTMLDGILWAHEFGHNQGLSHPDTDLPTRIMNGTLYFSGIGRQMTQAECNAWHSTLYNPGTVIETCPFQLTVNKYLAATSVVTSNARITYTLHINNGTFQSIADITVSDNIPISTTYTSGSAVVSPPIINLTNFPTGTTPFTLSAQSSVVITYTLQVGLVNSKDLLVNTATISGPAYPQPIQASFTAIVDPVKIYLPLIFKNN